jgi:hypothetical protein
MVGIVSLWLPIVLSAVLVFLFSSVVHMVLKYHQNDYSKVPGEDGVLEGMRSQKIPPGDYFFPFAKDPKEMKSPEIAKKFDSGPVGFMTILPNGPVAMGTSLIQWFIYALVIGAIVAYVTGRTVAPGAEYFSIFRVSGAVAFIAYAGAHPSASIWGKRKWSTTAKHLLDGLFYSLLVGGAFAGFWPE